MDSSYLQNINPEALLEYKDRIKELVNNAPNGALQTAEGITNAALSLGITLHHSGIIGKGSMFSDYLTNAKNLKETGQSAFDSVKSTLQNKISEQVNDFQEQGENLLNRVSSRLGGEQPQESSFEYVFHNAAYDPSTLDDEFVPSDSIRAASNPIDSTGQISASDMAELRSADPQQVANILNGDPTELGVGMSDRLFDLLSSSRQRLVDAGRTLAPSTDNIYSHSAGDAINQARLNGELQTTSNQPITRSTPPQTQNTLEQPGTASSQNTLNQDGIQTNLGTQDDAAIQGQESLEQTGEQTLKGTAQDLAKKAAGSTLDELTADSTVLDETPIGDIITVGLGIASLFETIFGLGHHEHQMAAPIVQSGQQVGI